MYLAPQVHGDGTTGGYTQQLGGCGLHGPVNVEPPSQHRLSHQQQLFFGHGLKLEPTNGLPAWLVVWKMAFIFPIILRMSSSQLTNSYFSEG